MTEEEFNLNDPNNLNPVITPVFKPLPQSSVEEMEVNKEEKIKRWNEKPEVKNNNIEAIDKNKFEKIGKKKLELFKILAPFGILSLVVIAIVAGIYGWTIYKDGTLLSPVNMVCGNLTCEKQECTFPNIPECAEHPCVNNCNLSCGDTTIKIVNGTEV